MEEIKVGKYIRTKIKESSYIDEYKSYKYKTDADIGIKYFYV